MVIAGEVSGDLHAGHLVHSLQEKVPDLHVWGIGGEKLQAAGVELLYDVDEMAVMGLSEVIQRYGFFKRVFNEMLDLATERRPDAVLLVDYPGFNLRFAKQAHARGLKVLYYVCPQVWAWNRKRIDRMAEFIDRLMVIFPFEVDVFKKTDLQVDFVGHPLVDEAEAANALPFADLCWGGEPRLALLPGSREHEVRRILPPMLEAAERIRRVHPGASFIIASPSKRIEQLIRDVMRDQHVSCNAMQIATGETREILRQADACWIASGTATIEAALMDCPMIVVYKTAWLTFLAGKLFVRIPHIGMVNIVARREICPELIQRRAKGAVLSRRMHELLEDARQYQAMKKGLADVRQRLGRGGAAMRAAELVAGELEDQGV